MSVIDPRLILEANKKNERFKLTMKEIAPEDLDPNGDRYIIEEIEMDDTFVMGAIMVVTNVNADPNANTAQADPTIEKRGVIAGVVIGVGNGHLLGLPDLAPVAQDAAPYIAGDRPWSSVDMFFQAGDVVFIDHNARGRAFKLPGRAIIRVCNQIDVLAQLKRKGVPVRLVRKDDTWVEAE